MLDPLLIVKFESFSNVWYWLILGLSWSTTCHNTIGVPYDALVRAHQKPDVFAADAEALAMINSRRYAHVMSQAGIFVLALAGFFLAALATFGFYYDYELAQGLFMLAAPLLLVQGLNMRLALKIADGAFEGEALRKKLVRRRFWNQVIGLLAIILTVLVAFVSFAKQLVIWY